MADSWQLDHDGWSETWHLGSRDGGFERVGVGNRSFVIGRDDLTALQPRIGQGCMVCRGMLPGAFAYCFACGNALQDAACAEDPCQGVPNASRPEARLPPLILADRMASPEKLTLPPGRQFGFAVAGQPARLFVIDRDGGWVHEFDRRQSSWLRLFRIGENTLPERSWSIAVTPAGIVVPAHGRLTVIDLTHGPLAQPANTTLTAEDVCIGGACVLQNEALVPILRAGVPHLARRRMLRGAGWSFEPVQGAPPLLGCSEDAAVLPRLALSAPVETEIMASWAGEFGYIVVTLGDDGSGGTPLWRNWRSGFTPLLTHRPYADPDGSVWQFGSAPVEGSRRTLSFERVAALSQAAHHDVGSSVLASGVLACRELTLRSRAWIEKNPYNRELPGRADDFLIPVQALSPTASVLMTAGLDRLNEFVSAGAEGLSPPLPASLRFHDGQTLHDLATVVNLQSLTQVAAFVFDGRLYVYDALENECWRWPLRLAA